MPGDRRTQWLIPGFLVLLLSGCNPFTEAEPMMDEYLSRLARVLDAPEASVPSELPPATTLPKRRDRVLQIPELELGMLDFLSLYGCELQYVVGERNSVMGRVMQPINRLRYEIRFIQSAERCVQQIDDAELQATLEQAVASKRETLSLAVWNATWGTEEIEKLFTLSKGYYPVAAEQNALTDLALDLDQLNEIVKALNNQKLGVPLSDLGQIHQRWQAQFLAGQVINSARLLIATLNSGTETLRSRLEGRPLCLNGKSNNQSNIVQSFFFKIYIGEVQPYMSAVSRARDSLIRGFARLAEQQKGVIPEAFDSWYSRHLSEDSGGSLWRELDQAMMRHTRHWQDLLAQCGLRPGA
ncbi:hypothetical protein DOQ08_02964 [Marinobacter litoralis]|uniref:DUF3080 domain-containing protein n=1 Tax=Marinobacter litoralis TaxID=187981 RepID=A0A3M2RA60_9GAMM|nr:DUF3080 domain-containing protein [Marinobacter litoralis]RMJ02168.1 hypothetical protein DOQ08_02964 [Marinobacter litoralis]